MNKRETAELVTLMKANYPDSFRGKSDTVVKGTINLWEMMFADEPAELVRNAVLAYMASNTGAFMPNVGQIKQAIQDLQSPDGGLSETEALARIMQASRNGIYGAETEFDKLPPMLQKVVGSSAQLREWAMMDADTVQSVIGSHVIRAYRTIKAREDAQARLSAAVRKFTQQLSDGVKMPEITKRSENEKKHLTLRFVSSARRCVPPGR